MITKYGILFKPTNEYVSWYDDETGKDVLFDANRDKVKRALIDIILSDGGIDDSEEDLDLKIISKQLPDEFDGSDLINGDFSFVDSKLVDSSMQ